MTAWLLAAALLAAEPTPLTLAVAGPPAEPTYLPLYAAEALGTFEAEGLRVTLRRVKGEGSAVGALRDGEVEVAATSVDQALRLGWARGTPLALVALTALSPPATLLVSARHREAIAKIDDLKGKRVAIPSPGTSVHHLMIHLLRRHGIEPHEARLVSLGATRTASQLATGELDAAVTLEPWTGRLLRQGQAVVLADFRDPETTRRQLSGAFYEAGLFVRKADAEALGGKLLRLTRALVRVLAWLRRAPPEAVADRLPPDLVGNREEFIARLAATKGLYPPDALASEEGMASTLSALRDASPLPAAVRVRAGDLLALDPLRETLKGLGEPPPAP